MTAPGFAFAQPGLRQPRATSSGPINVALRERRFEQAAELAREIDRHARVHGALAVEKALRAADGEHAVVPDVGMDVEPLSAVEAEAHEMLRSDVVPRQRPR